MAHDHSHDVDLERRASAKLPVVILTGYLGAGKTTLLNYVLHEQSDKKLAVIENEIGEVSVDDALVEQKHMDSAEELVVLNNGCICCTIRGDLQKTLQHLAKKHQEGKVKLDGVLIELTGAADPAPVVQTFLMGEDLSTFSVDNVIALVDAKHFLEKLDESQGDPNEKGTACSQIAFASTVLLNKVDLVDETKLVECEKRLNQVNRSVDIIRCQQARVPLDKLFNVGAFHLEKVLEEQYMDEEEFMTFYKPKMDTSISNVGVKFDGAVNLWKLVELLGKFIGEYESAKDFMRIKGVFNIMGDDRMFVLQCVHMVQSKNFGNPWGDKPRENRIIFIGRGMQQRRKELTDAVFACIAGPLRFEVGTRVQLRTGMGENDYAPGKVIKHWAGWFSYLVQQDSGEEEQVQLDTDFYVKAA